MDQQYNSNFLRQFQYKSNVLEEDLMSVSLSVSTSTKSDSKKNSLEAASRTFTIAQEETKDILDMLRHSIDRGELRLKQNNKVDNETQAFVMDKLMRSKLEDNNDDERGLAAEEKRDEQRLARLDETRSWWLVMFLKLGFHLMVFANFFMSWFDSSRLLLEDAKMSLWLLEDDYNCLDIVPSVDWVDHSINILHALLSSSVLYVHNRDNATLCLAWIVSQAGHLCFKTFQHFYNLKFESEAFANFGKIEHLSLTVLFDVVGSLLLLHKYYDLTDRFKARAIYFGTNDTTERSLNYKIIYRNQSAFLQRKNILREATVTQTYAIIKKIGKHAKKGIKVDQISLNQEIRAAKLALTDCETAENHNMIYALKKAYAHRLKELEDAEMLQQHAKDLVRKDSIERNLPIIQSEVY